MPVNSSLPSPIRDLMAAVEYYEDPKGHFITLAIHAKDSMTPEQFLCAIVDWAMGQEQFLAAQNDISH